SSNNEDILEKLCSSVGLVSWIYICRLYVQFSNLPSMIMSSNARTELIKQLVNDRYNSKHNTKDIVTVTNIIAMNKDLINPVLLLSDFTEKSVIVYMNHVKIDVLNDMTLLPFTEVCVICNEVLTTYRSKSIHVIDCV
ncbi:unnamed protein product, partial [Rotaria magnacalcarata]